MSSSPDLLRQSAEILVRSCGRVVAKDSALIISNPETEKLGRLLETEAKKITENVQHLVIPPANMHGAEPTAEIAEEMKRRTVIFGITKMSLAHTKARYEACNAGARYLSLPDYSDEVMSSPALHVDFDELVKTSQRVADLFTNGNDLHLTTKLGTDFRVSFVGRTGNAAPGVTLRPGDLASPPDSEANVAVLEGTAEGTVVVDGSIPCRELGLLAAPITLKFEKGAVVSFSGGEAKTLEAIFNRHPDAKARNLGEFGIGLNPKAKLQGFMLEDEGCLGTVHLGIGSNSTIGGKNKVSFHLDHIIRDADLSIDGRAILRDGRLLI